jgi:hypothetical protein
MNELEKLCCLFVLNLQILTFINCLCTPTSLLVGAQESTKWPRNIIPYTIGSNFTGKEKGRGRERGGEGGREGGRERAGRAIYKQATELSSILIGFQKFPKKCEKHNRPTLMTSNDRSDRACIKPSSQFCIVYYTPLRPLEDTWIMTVVQNTACH